jgi:hypothetical protein
MIWRAGYSAGLRRHARWYFRHGMGRKALGKLARATATWPFFNPIWQLRFMADYLRGRGRPAEGGDRA